MDEIIDTNVLLVASAQHPGSPFKDSDVPAEQKQEVLTWLMDFWKDDQRKMVLDQSFKIWDEYHNQMTRGQDIGSLVAAEKLQFAARFVEVSYDKDGHGCVPPELEKVDPSDRKFVAIALKDLSDGGSSRIVSAEDRGWYNCEEALKQAGVVVLQLIEEWSRARWEEKQKQPKPIIGRRPVRSRKKPT